MITDVLELRGHLLGQPDYRIRMHVVHGWLNSNDRGHWRKSNATIRAWRQQAGWAARAARVPDLGRAYILAELRFPDALRRDPANWYPTVKACVDGLVDVAVLANDSADHLLGPDVRLGPVAEDKRASITLHLWRLP